jgi:hypothetical protein
MRRLLTRLGLALLGLLHLSWGVAATAAPRWFFDSFPGFGAGWTAGYPPYNAHLMTDVGAAFAAPGVLLLAATWFGDHRVTVVVLLGTLVFSGLHLTFHLRDHGDLHGADYAASVASLVAGVLAPVVLLLMSRPRPA